MIQELLGGGGGGHAHAHGLLGGERKIPILEASSSPSPSSPSPSPSPCSSTATANPAAPAPPPEGQNLRCPRCDSTNTKFCYYNNYNLTQPRHFCKTCRRYWTKGGALRNVPIGGGCRKNKNVTFTAAPASAKAGAGRLMAMSPDIGRQGIGLGFDQNSPVLWSAPQNCSNLIALFRSTQNQNSNPNPNPSIISSSPSSMKDENVMMGSHLNLPFNNQQSPILWRNNQNQTQLQQTELVLGHEVQNTGLQDLYQRLRSTGSYYPDHSSVLLNNAVSSSSSTMVLESAPVAGGGELGYWNPTPSWTWSDLPTTNGTAYP